MKRVLLVLFGIFAVGPHVYATGDYILPYPGPMPGNKLYAITRFFDAAERYWYFGELGQARYYRQLADKYLVEAKVLFEYKQYLLAQEALQRSDNAFSSRCIKVEAVGSENKKRSPEILISLGHAGKHVEELGRMKANLPESFVWQDEKRPAVELAISQSIDRSIQLRKDCR